MTASRDCSTPLGMTKRPWRLDTVIPSSLVVRHSRQHVGGAPGVINNAVRLEQCRNHHNALCPGVDYALQIADVDSADAENRQTHVRVNPFDICKADGRVVRFCGRGEDRAEADIVRAFMLRCERLVEAVRGFSIKTMRLALRRATSIESSSCPTCTPSTGTRLAISA